MGEETIKRHVKNLTVFYECQYYCTFGFVSRKPRAGKRFRNDQIFFVRTNTQSWCFQIPPI